MRVEKIGLATLYLGDSREVMPMLPRPAALISDPPYGQKWKPVSYKHAIRGVGKLCGGRSGGQIIGDDAPFDPTLWLGAADIVLLWGAHKFADRLPPGQWLVWDKLPNGKVKSQGCGEAAWLGRAAPMRIFRFLWDGAFHQEQERTVDPSYNDPTWHPTQKPTPLMDWCITQARVPEGGTILDPFMGAGSTGIAAVRRGHPFIGIELEPQYFDAACRRIEAATRAIEADPPLPLPPKVRAPARRPSSVAQPELARLAGANPENSP